MDAASATKADQSGTLLSVHVIPNARAYSIEYDHWRKELRIKVKAQPRKGKANQDVVQFLGTYFNNPVIVAGAKSYSKKIRIENTQEETVTILGELL
jgi:uncharacterized protein (TIGR00251 family)